MVEAGVALFKLRGQPASYHCAIPVPLHSHFISSWHTSDPRHRLSTDFDDNTGTDIYHLKRITLYKSTINVTNSLSLRRREDIDTSVLIGKGVLPTVMGCFERAYNCICFGWHGFFGLKERRLLTVSKIIHHIDDFLFLSE
jgi:hypothetical protein